MKKVLFALGMAAVVCALPARAALSFTFTYNDGVNAANGLLTTTFLGGNQYLATAGTLNVTAASDPAAVGTYNLLPGGPSTVSSPSGAFLYNNVLYYPGDPGLDISGLLGFQSGNLELNIFGNAPGQYSFYVWEAGVGYIVATGGNDHGVPAEFILTPVPEPTTMIAGALLLLPFGASTIRILRKKA